jgi:hypothetical protein
MNKYLPYVHFLKASFHVDLPFSVDVLTEEHRKIDSRVPAPGLSLFESQDLFRLLEKRELVYQKVSGESYFLSKIQPNKWDELISELKRPDFTFHWWYKSACRLITFSASVVFGAFIGGYLSKKGGDLASIKPAIEIYPANRENSPNPNSEPKTTDNNQPVNKQE